MNRQTVFTLVAMLAFMAFMSLSAQNAMASSGHDHHAVMKHGEGISPFHGQSPKHTLHCILLGHTMNKPCPKGTHENKVPCELSRPCHDGAVPGPASSGGSGHFEFVSSSMGWDFPLPLSATQPITISFHTFISFSPLDHPPQFV